MPEQTTRSLEDVPPSAKLVYKVLEYADDPLTQAEIKAETRLTQRTVYNALKELEKIDVVKCSPRITDLRQSLYQLK